MKFIQKLSLSWIIFIMNILLSSMLYAASGIGLPSRPEVEGLHKVKTWIRTDHNNIYGRRIELLTIRELDGLLNRLDTTTATFRDTLSNALFNNIEFKEAASKKSLSNSVQRWKDLLFSISGVASGSLNMYLIYNSQDLTVVSKGVSYGISSLALADSLLSLGKNIKEIYSTKFKPVLPSEDAIRTEADKISLFLSFKDYRTLVTRRVSQDLDLIVGEYVSRILGILSMHYPADSKQAFVNTLLNHMG